MSIACDGIKIWRWFDELIRYFWHPFHHRGHEDNLIGATDYSESRRGSCQPWLHLHNGSRRQRRAGHRVVRHQPGHDAKRQTGEFLTGRKLCFSAFKGCICIFCWDKIFTQKICISDPILCGWRDTWIWPEPFQKTEICDRTEPGRCIHFYLSPEGLRHGNLSV